MDEKIVMLDESDLDGVVGGTFNQKVVNDLGLAVLTGPTGKTGLYVHIEGTRDGKSHPYTGNTTENGLRKAVSNYSNLTVSVKTTSGQMRTLSGDELKALLS